MEYYPAVNNNDIMKFAGKKNILSEVTQTQKDKHGSTLTLKWILATRQRKTGYNPQTQGG